MSKVEITPELLADIEAKANKASSNSDGRWGVIDNPHTGGWGLCIHDQGDIIARATGRDKEWKNNVFNHIAAANPATVLAMIKRIRRLEAAQCWVVVDKWEGDAIVDGPYFTQSEAQRQKEIKSGFSPQFEVRPWKGGA